MSKILIVEDECAINELIAMNLAIAGYDYDKAFDGVSAIKKILNYSYDLILLDIMLPEKDGYEIMPHIKNIPVIFITAKSNLSEKIKGFELGAVDYIVKPFEMLELIARIKVALRRNTADEIFRTKDLEINFCEMLVRKNGEIVSLTHLEYRLLEMLVKNKNIALSREKILETVWGYDFEGDTRTVDVHIQKLRCKLGLECNIKTVFKTGYRFEVKR